MARTRGNLTELQWAEGSHRLLPWRGAGLAVATGAANAAFSRRLRHAERLQLAALELAFIAGAYPAMAVGGSRRALAVELGSAAVFVAVAFGALARRSPSALATGLVAHGAWDLVHHRSAVGAQAPKGYPGFCLVADLLLALPLVAPGAGVGRARMERAARFSQ